VESAAELFSGRHVTVLTVWQPFVEVAARSSLGFGMVPSIPDSNEIDEASAKGAQNTAAEGVELAGGRGLNAEPLIRSQTTTTARAILAEAETLGAEAIVMGSRGLTGVKSLLLGSVSHEVIQHADLPVVVVPSPDIAAKRAREVRGEAGE